MIGKRLCMSIDHSDNRDSSAGEMALESVSNTISM